MCRLSTKKNERWRHILANKADYRIDRAKSMLELEITPESVYYPEIEYFFTAFRQQIER